MSRTALFIGQSLHRIPSTTLKHRGLAVPEYPSSIPTACYRSKNKVELELAWPRASNRTTGVPLKRDLAREKPRIMRSRNKNA